MTDDLAFGPNDPRTITVCFTVKQGQVQLLPFWDGILKPIEINGAELIIHSLGDGNKFDECDAAFDLLDAAEEVISKKGYADKYAEELVDQHGYDRAVELIDDSNILNKEDIDDTTGTITK